ncbi:NirD/YgiW/YdeI family stress tolerance protein [Alcaligenaceae bacterium]|nr:NirD/YgiW/YdeI family stress tolerance protein [Alcaligenaceae bacterium]
MSIQAKISRLVVVAAVVSFFTFPAQAQYSGPSTIGEGTVAAILAKPVDDQPVQLQGHLLRQTSHDKYIFSDGTAEIVAEIKAKRFPNQPINEKTKVEIIGEVDTGLTRPPEIEVDSVQVIE